MEATIKETYPDIPTISNGCARSVSPITSYDAQDLSRFEYWEAGTEPDLSFFDMLKSEDWISSSLVGDMQG